MSLLQNGCFQINTFREKRCSLEVDFLAGKNIIFTTTKKTRNPKIHFVPYLGPYLRKPSSHSSKSQRPKAVCQTQVKRKAREECKHTKPFLQLWFTGTSKTFCCVPMSILKKLYLHVYYRDTTLTSDQKHACASSKIDTLYNGLIFYYFYRSYSASFSKPLGCVIALSLKKLKQHISFLISFLSVFFINTELYSTSQ